jgi:transcriptional regulator with XRE-family HTH domain
MNLRDIGQHLHQRREALGLSQDRLAKLAGLSRATINQLENGAPNDLGAAKLMALLDLVGLRMEMGVSTKARHGLLMASRTASVSYKAPLSPTQLAKALATGELPSAQLPQVASFMDEAPLPLVVAAVEEAAAKTQVAPKIIWRHLARWAAELQSPRKAWT